MISQKDINDFLGHNLLRENVDKYIELFTNVYGVEYKELIESKFKKMILIGYTSPEDLKNMINNMYDKYSKNIQAEYLKEHGYSTEEINELVSNFFNSSIKNKNYNFNDYKKYLEDYYLGIEGRKEKYIKEGYTFFKENLDSNLTIDEYMSFINNGINFDNYAIEHRYFIPTMESYLHLDEAEKRFNYQKQNASFSLEIMGFDIGEIDIDDIHDKEEYIKFDKMVIESDNIDSKIQEVIDFLKPYEEYIESAEKLKNKLNKKYSSLLLENMLPYFSENDKLKTLEELKKSYPDFSNINSYRIFMKNNYDDALIYSFSEENDELLKDEEMSYSWTINSIKENRIEYFKIMGVDLGDNYEDYLNSKEAKNIWPKIEFVKDIINIKEKLSVEKDNEYFENLSFNKKINEELTRANLLDPEISFNVNLYSNKTTCVNPNITKIGDKYEILPLVLISVDDSDSLDHKIIHELNHVLELSLQNVDYNTNAYTAVCGWDYIYGNVSNEVSEIKEHRKYELFNEIINELIAKKITENAIENNLLVFNDKENIQYKKGTAYDDTTFIVKDFFEEYIEDILKSRKDGNINIIFDKVGKENFDDMNDLFKLFNDNFSGMRYYSLMRDLENNIDNDQTNLYYFIVEQKDIILNKMNEYALNNSKSM